MKSHRIVVLAVLFVGLSLVGYGIGHVYAASTGTTLNGGDSLSVHCSGSSLAWSQADGLDGVASCAPTTTTTVAPSSVTPAPLAASYSEAAGFPIYGSGTGLSSLTIAPTAAGDLVVMFVEVASNVKVTGINSTNVTWSAAPATIDDDSTVPLHVELWYGTATSTASATTTVSYSVPVSLSAVEIIADEFHANAAGTWALAQGGSVNGSSTTVRFPSLTSTSAGGLYVGYSRLASSYVSCNSSGFSCWGTPTANVELKGTNLGASSAYSPSPTQSVNSEFTSTAGLFYLSAPSTTSSTTDSGGGPTTSTSTSTTTSTSTSTPATTTPPSTTTTAPSGSSGGVPALSHVFLIVMENQPSSAIIGNSAAPYLNQLARQYAYASNYSAISHPSLPNYLALTGGSTFGVTTDCNTCYVSAHSIADTVEAAGKTARAYEESMPSPCYLDDAYPYVVHHDPFVYYTDMNGNATRCNGDVVPYGQLAGDLSAASKTPSFAFITPNMCDDMHDCSVAQGDSWLSQNVPAILNSPAFTTQNSALFITWDEDDGSLSNQVAMIAAGPAIRSGYVSTGAANHYSLLRTIEDALGLPALNSGDGGALPMADLFK